jgi:c-di-GMP-related signal transduction protein
LHERFIARQPIFDQRLKVFAYELLFRAGPQNIFQSSKEASSSVVVASTMVFDLEMLVGPAKAFVNFDEATLLRGAARLLPPSRIIVEILESVTPTPEVVHACSELCHAGYVLALDDYVDDPKWKPLIELAKFLKVDFRALDAQARRAIAERYLPRGLKLVAEKVETQADVQNARSLGFSYFQGYFFCKPSMMTGRDIPANKLTCLRLLKVIAAPEISYEEVEDLLKQDPSLIYKLLRYLNSPLMGFRSEVHNIRHAISLLGEVEFRRWISIVALVAMVGDKPSELIRTALLRAYFCEEVSLLLGMAQRRSDFFLMGLLSVIDALLDQPMEDILSHLAVSEEVRTALCGGSNRFRDVYDTLLAYEHADWNAFSSAAARLGSIEDRVPDCYVKAAERAMVIAG